MSFSLRDLEVFGKISPENRIPLAIGMEITCRCNLNCRHCYINQSVSHEPSKASELSIEEIDRISDQALALGTLWFKLSGGELLVRKDFEDIYILLKKKGLLVSILTNGTLLNQKHIELFKKYPPRAIEISAYGATQNTYEQVTGSKTGFHSFIKALSLCMEAGLPITLKALNSKSLHNEMKNMQALISGYQKGFFVEDDILISRIDRNTKRSEKIDCERLLKKKLPLKPVLNPIKKTYQNYFKGNLFLCNAGINSCWIDSTGMVHLCNRLRYPEFAYNLRKGSLKDYWNKVVPKLLGTCSINPQFDDYCGRCPKRLQCHWCPALSWTENDSLDRPVDFVCISHK